jgi:PAS domain S-box-containing protein
LPNPFLPRRFRSTTTLGVVWAILVIDLFVAAAAWRWIVVERRDAYDQAALTAQNLARVLGENLEGTLRQIDLALLATSDEIVRVGGGGAPDAELDGYIARLASRLPVLDAIRTASAEGFIAHGVDVPKGAPVDVGDRDYFVAARAGDGMVVSAPLVSRVTGKRSIVLARRVGRADGTFGGVVYAVVALDRLTGVLTGVDVGRDGLVEIRGAGLGLIARHPDSGDAGPGVGERKVPPELERAVAAAMPEAIFRTVGARDAIERVVALRTLPGRAFHVAVGLSSRAFLAGWRVATWQTLGITAAFILLTIVAGRRILRAWSREVETRFRKLVDDAPIAMALSHGTRMAYVNREFIREFRLPDGKVAIGRSLLDNVAPEDSARTAERIERRMRAEPVEPTTEITLRRGDGSSFKASVTDATVEAEGGTTIVAFVQDVTVQRRSEEERERLIAELKKALAEVKTLSGLLPICAHCKMIRDDRGYWNRIETFIRDRSSAEFTHGICPECADRYFPNQTEPGKSD